MLPAEPRYRYIRDLGRGAFGYVVLAQDTISQDLVAVKKLPRALAADTQLERELLAHSSLRHPHVVRFHQVFLSPHHCNLVLEYVPDGTLLEHVQQRKSLPELQARWLFQQLILAMDYCHSSGVSNRDIKLENILLDKSNRGRPEWPILKICDWGYARAGFTSEASSKVGTLSYMAPEVLKGDSYSTKRADIWSCGVVLYAMLCGRMPFAVHEQQSLNMYIEQVTGDMQQRRFALPARLSADAADLLGQLLHPDPAARINIAGVMNHPWFLTALPREALAMNSRFLAAPRACSQSEEDIWRVIRTVRRRTHAVDSLQDSVLLAPSLSPGTSMVM